MLFVIVSIFSINFETTLNEIRFKSANLISFFESDFLVSGLITKIPTVGKHIQNSFPKYK